MRGPPPSSPLFPYATLFGFVEEKPPADLAYTKGVVAMAKGGADPPGTSGSQFFVVTAEDAMLPPEYALVGKVTKGLDRKSTRLNSSHANISYAVFCLKK